MLIDHPPGISSMSVQISGSELRRVVYGEENEFERITTASYSFSKVFTRVTLDQLSHGLQGDPFLDLWDNPEIPENSFLLVADPLAPSYWALKLLKIPQRPGDPYDEDIDSPQIGTWEYHDSGDPESDQNGVIRITPRELAGGVVPGSRLWIDSMRAWPSVYYSPMTRAETLHLLFGGPFDTRWTDDEDVRHDTPEYFNPFFYPYFVKGSPILHFGLDNADIDPGSAIDFEATRVQAADFAMGKPEIQRITLPDGYYLKDGYFDFEVDPPVFRLSLAFTELFNPPPDEDGFTQWDKQIVLAPVGWFTGDFGTRAPLNRRFLPGAGQGVPWVRNVGEEWIAPLNTAAAEIGIGDITFYVQKHQDILVVIQPSVELGSFPLLRGKCGPFSLELVEPRPFESGEGHVGIAIDFGGAPLGLSRLIGLQRFTSPEPPSIPEPIGNMYPTFDVASGNPSFSFSDSDSHEDEFGGFAWDYSVDVTF